MLNSYVTCLFYKNVKLLVNTWEKKKETPMKKRLTRY